MYQIKCDDFHLYDYRLPELIVTDPKVKTAVNTVGEASFVIHRNHPYYSQLKVLKSIFEISDEIGVIFRGRMTNNSQDFHNSKAVDLEGLMAFFNDSVVRPFKFPEDFSTDAGYLSASKTGNVVEFFLKWLIDNHNSQVQDFQKFKLGNVTVTDPNNYLSRSESKYANTWEILKTKLFDSALGGNLCIRYEDDGNYIDYLAEFELTNTQEIKYGENLIDLKNEIDAASTYSAVIPIGAEVETNKVDGNGEKIKKRLDLTSIADGTVAPDVIKQGDTIYSQSAVNDFGWIYAPVEDTTWEDVTEVSNLLNKGIAYLTGEGIKLQNNVEINAVDLHFTDAEIRSFRLYRNVKVNSLPHNQEALFPLASLEIDLLRPQNTKIVLGRTQRTLSEITNDRYQSALDHIQYATDDLKGKVSVTLDNLNDLNTKIEGIDGTYLYIMYSPYEDGHEMTVSPDENTMYMGTCSTNAEERPEDYTLYTWVKVRGIDGEDGTPGLPGTNQYFHIKYSDDGIEFTEDNGEVLGDWMGTCIDNNEDDPEDFDAYTWHRIKGEQGIPGTDGIGIDGTSSYFHVRYSEYENPTKEQMTEEPSKYIGTYVDNIEDDSDDPSKYKWVQFMGTDGIPGIDGENGQTYYLHIKYSNDNGKTFTGNNGEDSGKYIGVYTDTTQADSTNVSDYKWSLIKGADGVTYYTWIKYADDDKGTGMSESPEGKKYIGLAYNKPTPDESGTASDYKWSLIQGENGYDGEDGKTYYTWVKYADDEYGNGITDDPTGKKYIGLAYNKNTPDESSTKTDYKWALFRGEDGLPGQNQYFYVRYSANADGNPMYDTPQDDSVYIGVCATTSDTPPNKADAYTWSYCKGNQGIPGEPGENGKTQYWHIKYSDDGENFTDEDGEVLGAWIGTYVDFEETDSLNFADYTWKKFTEDVDEELEDIRTIISSQSTDIERTEEQISLIASKSYVETSAFDSYKEEVTSEFTQRADQIDMKFTTTTEQINNVDGDLQAKFEKVAKYISFNENGISIGGGKNAMLLTLDNDNGIIFSRNGVPFGWWDGNDFHTGNIVVEVSERAQFGNFAFVPRSDGSLSFLKVDGSSSDAHTHNYIETVITAATCTDKGTKVKICSGCGINTTEEIAALGHDYRGVVTPPTETAQGYTTFTCSRCGDKYISDYTSATGCTHSYTSRVVAATCTEQGYTEHTCSKCGTSYKDTYTAATGHSYSAKTTTAATCTTVGTKTLTCTKCSHSYTEDIPELGHIDSDGNGYCDRCSATTGTFYTLSLNVSPTAGGTVSGAGSYLSGTNVQIKATANSGYHFVAWKEGSTEVSTSATTTVTVNKTRILIANFEKDTVYYTISTAVSPSGSGTVTGGGSYASGTNVTLTATANNSGYKFKQWNDGNTNATRTIVADSNKTYTATFEAVQTEQTITEGVETSVNIPVQKEVVYLKFVPKYSGSYTFVSLDQSSLDPDGYIYLADKQSQKDSDTSSGGFSVSWDGFVAGTTYYLAARLWSGTGTLKVKVTKDAVVQNYTITTAASPSSYGSVTGGGIYANGSTATLTATANSGYRFTKWQDGNTDNPRSVTVTGNATYTATFEAVTANTEDTIATGQTKTVTVGNSNASGLSELSASNFSLLKFTPTVTAEYSFRATGYTGSSSDTCGCLFNSSKSTMLTSNDDIGDSSHFSVRYNCTAGTTYYLGVKFLSANTGGTITVECDTETKYTLTVQSSSTEGGTVSGGGTVKAGETCSFSATAKDGYEFAGWYDGDVCITTSASYQLTMTANKTLTAKFSKILVDGQYTLKIWNGIGTPMPNVKVERNGEDVTLTDPSNGWVGGYAFNEGDTFKLTATPAEGRTFSYWHFETKGSRKSVNPYTFTVTASNNGDVIRVYC